MAYHDPHIEQKQKECLELFLKYDGREHERIEWEMRQRGWSRFSRRILHNRNHRGRHELGWIDKLGWRDKLIEQFEAATGEARTGAASIPACEAGSYGLRSRRGIDLRETAHHNAGGTGVASKDARRSSQHQLPVAPVDAVTAFHAWIKRVSPNFDWDAPHHRYLCEQLERVTNGECKRLIINIPPRHGKSQLVTVRYAAWRLKQDAATKVIIGSYGQKLASKFSRDIRRTLSDDWALKKIEKSSTGAATTGAASIHACDAGSSGVNAETITTVPANNATVTFTSSSGFITNGCVSTLTDPNRRYDGGTSVDRRNAYGPGGDEDENPFPFIKARLKNTESEWETTKGGGVRAVGVGGGVTGFGANLVIIDDPIKSRAEAESKNRREAVWDWFNDDIYTRLEPDAAIILIQTRWHEDDLAGRLIKNMNEEDGEHWEVINLPAIAIWGVEETRIGGDGETTSEPGAVATGFPLTSRQVDDIETSHNKTVRQAGLPPQTAPSKEESPASQLSNAELNHDPEPVIQPMFKPKVIGYPRLYSRVESEPPALAGGTNLAINDEDIQSSTLSTDKRRDVTPLVLPSGAVPPAYAGGSDICDPLDRLPGEALWPARYPVAKLEKTQFQIGTYSFASLYQQEPVPREGGMFKREWFDRIIAKAPPGLRWVRGYDLGVTTNATSDYTASYRVAFDKDENMYIDGGFRRRIEFPDQRRYILERIFAERDTEHCVEGTHNGDAIVQDILKYQPRLGRILRSKKVTDPKTARAIPWINTAEQGRLYLIRGPWNDEFVDEACSFPRGTHDDQIDAVSLAVKILKEAKYRLYGFV